MITDQLISTFSATVDSINLSLAELCVGDDFHSQPHHYFSDIPRRFTIFAQRLQLALTNFLRSSDCDSFSPSVHTCLKGIDAELSKSIKTVSIYKSKSKIFVLLNCVYLCHSMNECSSAISGWLALLDGALVDHPELHKKVSDLSRDIKLTHFKVTENEERVFRTLQKEGKRTQAKLSKAVQSGIVMDLGRALGIDPENHQELSEQIELFKNDLTRFSLTIEKKILASLEQILENWAIELPIHSWSLHLDFEDEGYISPIKIFFCPLTKEVMKEPVVLESSQTYERSAIQFWFERCSEDGREPICPVTGKVVEFNLELRPNIGLAGAIEEWINRNVEIQVKFAVQHLSKELPEVNCIEKVLDGIYKISEEHPISRYRIRNAGIVLLIVKLLKNSSNNKSIGTNLRSKALLALLGMIKDEESKNIMLEEGITRLAIRSLIGSSEKEREHAVKLLLEFCSDEACCTKIASEKGALVLLSSMAENLECAALSNLAEDVLLQMERIEDNVQHLAAIGRFEPLLIRLCEGPDNVKIKMASMVGRMTLTNTGKEQIARRSSKILIDMLTKSEAQAPTLLALYNLSSLGDNATILVESCVLPILTDILFEDKDTSTGLKELAARTIANIVSNPGYWELAPADREGHSMQSESFVHSILGVLSVATPRCQAPILHILCRIASSSQASECVASHIRTGEGIGTILRFLEHSEVEHRIYAFSLTKVLSAKFGQDVANELRFSNNISLLKERLLDSQSTDGERSDAACILAYLPLPEDELRMLLGADFVRWTVDTLKNQLHTRSSSNMLEGLLGLLLQFTSSLTDPHTLHIIGENHLMAIFREVIYYPTKPSVRQLAALGLKNLSECGKLLAAGNFEPPATTGFFFSLVFMCRNASFRPLLCPIHNVPCEEDSQFCLLKSNCIEPLVNLLNDEETTVQTASLEALSTLFLDTSDSLKRVANELEKFGVVDSVIELFIQVRPGELQERTIWIIDRILRVDNHNQRHSLNQPLLRALVEAFKHGNSCTKRHAQDALISLRQSSWVSSKGSSQARSRR